jgi:hypothetical protein
MLKDFTNALTNENFRQDDEFSVGLYLIEDHRCSKKSDFENSFSLFIANTCCPKTLELNKNRFIHSLKTLEPHGINAIDPFGILNFDMMILN